MVRETESHIIYIIDCRLKRNALLLKIVFETGRNIIDFFTRLCGVYPRRARVLKTVFSILLSL